MTSVLTISSWSEIVDGRDGDDAAEIAIARLAQTPWLARLGTPSNRDGDVVRVRDWKEAFRMFAEGIPDEHATGVGTSRSGTLNAPIWLLLGRLDRDEALHRKTADVANKAIFKTLPDRHYAAAKAISRSIPVDVWPNPAELEEAGPVIYAMQTIGDYLHEYIRLLLIEVYAGDVAEPRCTYFRDQLGWLLAGLLPCGWDGKWPQGRMQVF